MELFIESIRSLVANKLRTFLSMLGIIIGVTAMIAVVSIGQGATASITERISSLGSNVFMISPGFSGGSSGRAYVNLSDVLTKKDVENISMLCPSIKGVSPLIQQRFSVKQGTNNTSAQIYAIYPDFFQILNLDLESGRIINQEDINEYAKVGVIGKDIANDLCLYQIGRCKSFHLAGILPEKGAKSHLVLTPVRRKEMNLTLL